MSDNKKNFVKVTVSTGYNNAATTVVLASGHGALLPDPAVANFNLVWYNSTDYSNPADDPYVEIPRVTGKSTDTLTIARPDAGNSYNGETSANTAQNHNIAGKTYSMILAATYKVFADLDTDIAAKVTANGAITGATKTKITYDAKGLVTDGADATTADIADSSNKRYVTDANLTTIGNQSGTNTGDETGARLATLITGAGAQTTPLDADEFPFYKIVGTVFSKVTWANIKATLKTYFDALYSAVNPLATDTLWDAKGDVVTGSGSNTAVRTAVGSDGQILAADSAGSGGVGWKNAPNTNNLLKNGNFINNSGNGYGTTNGSGDDWVNAGSNVVGGGAFPTMTKQQLIDLLGINDGDIEGLWNLTETSGNATDLSSNAYHLTDTNTVLYSADGLMGNARDFEASATEYLTIADASCANLELTGSRTFFAFIKPESLAANMHVMGKSPNDAANYSRIYVSATGKVGITATGLTTNTTVVSDVSVETGKWYFVVGVIDIAGTSMEIWVNGIKKSVTCSGASGDTNGAWSIGRLGTWTGGDYFDGLIQNVGVLSVALTDAQVKKLFAATMYKGIKQRRATSDGISYQYLPDDVVERLRGKTITLVGKLYQDTANVGKLRINDGSSTDSTANATTGSWVDISVTKTISATATAIYIACATGTSDGSIWWKELALYESPIALPYAHSPDDWARFPRLLRMDFPLIFSGLPYQYEENRVYTWSPVISSTLMDSGTGGVAPTVGYARWSYSGRFVSGIITFTNAVKNTATDYILVTASFPISWNTTININRNIGTVSSDLAGAKSGAMILHTTLGTYFLFNANVADNASMTNLSCNFNYEIN